MTERAGAGRATVRGTRFALAKFRPPALPATLIKRPELHELLVAGSGQRLTVVVGSAGAGKTVLLAGWAEGSTRIEQHQAQQDPGQHDLPDRTRPRVLTDHPRKVTNPRPAQGRIGWQGHHTKKGQHHG